jgi:NTE family protein
MIPEIGNVVDNKLAFALSGGGSRGALQVGAMYALLEYGLQPDLLIGVSIGAANATHLALKGFSKESLDMLVNVWHQAGTNDLLPANYIWLTVRAMFGRSSRDPSRHLKEFLIAKGITPELNFAEIRKPQLILVSSNLNTGEPILHGVRPDDKVLDALLLSTALPPWFMPERKQDRYLVDGAVVSHLPVEPAMNVGATKIVALDLLDSGEIQDAGDGVRGFFGRLIRTVEKRQVDLELKLAKARGIPVFYLGLMGETPIPIWDFHHTDELIARGYEITRSAIEEQQFTNPVLTPGV